METTETPRRLTLADAYRDAQHVIDQLTTRRPPAEPSPMYEIARKSPAGKTSGFEFTITHPDPDAAAELAKRWDTEFPAPQPIAKV